MNESRQQPSLADPERWSERARGGTSIEDAVGDAFGCVREAPPWTKTSGAARLALATPARRRGARVWRLALAAAVVLAASGGAIAARGWLAPRRADQTVLVPPGATVVVVGPRRRRLSVLGPARLQIEPATLRSDVVISGGLMTAEAGDRPLSVRAAEVDIWVPGGAIGEVDGRRAGDPAVRAIKGELRTAPGAGMGAAPGPHSSVAPALPGVAPAPAESAAEGVPPAPPGRRPVDRRLAVVAAAPATPAIPPLPRRPRSSSAWDQGGIGVTSPARAAREPAAQGPSRAPEVAAAPPPSTEPAPAAFALAPPAPPAPPARAAAAAPAAVGESELLARAFRAVRVDHDPQRALHTLDEHQRRFPAGGLRAEARLARLEALLASGRKAEARSLLAGVEAEGLVISQEMRLLRGELLAEAGRCGEALPDFDRLIAPAGAARKPGERALYGRASCRLRAGDRVGARLDLERYLALYPRGRFHGEVAAALAALPTP